MKTRIFSLVAILIGIAACTPTPPPQPRIFETTNTTVSVKKRINTSQSVNPGACTKPFVEGDICYNTTANTVYLYNGTALEALH